MGVLGSNPWVTVGLVSLLPAIRRTSPMPFEERGETIRARLDYELGRARRYGGSVSIVVFRAKSTWAGDVWQRFADTISGSLRDVDRFWIEPDRVTLVLPETDVVARSHVVTRILRGAELGALAIEVSASTFPEEAPTSDALLRTVSGDQGRQLP